MEALMMAKFIASTARLYGGLLEAESYRAQGAYQQMVANFNSDLSLMQAEDAVQRGESTASRIKTQANQLQGTQRAAYAAQGVEVDSGSAAEIQADTKRMATLDAITARNNAAREAWGFKVQAFNYRTQGEMAKRGADSKAVSTIITSGANYIDSLSQGGGGSKGASAAMGG